MKQFIRKIILYGLCFLLVELLLVCLVSDSYSRSSHEANVRLASERIARIKEPKIVIIGGSGCQFGFLSQFLAEHYGRPVVNTGTHACIGLQLQINLFRHYLQPGDIVLLIPEYDQYCVEKLFLGCVDESMLRIMLSNYPEGLLEMTPEQWIHVLPLLPQFLSKASTHEPIGTWSPYSIEGINEYGDEANWEYRNAVFQDNPRIDVLVADPSPRVMVFISDFIGYCNTNDIQCLLFPPAIARTVGEANASYVSKLQQMLEDYQIPFVAEPQHYFMPDSLCYDSYYHLIYEGAKRRTQMIIQDIDSLNSY